MKKSITSDSESTESTTDNPRRWVRIERAADYLDFKVCYLRRLVARYEIPYYKLGKYLLFELGELDDWVLDQRVDPVA